MIRYDDKPPIASDDQYIIPFRALKRVVWSITGTGGATSTEEIKHVFELAARTPNMTGLFMDDFLKDGGEGALTVEELRNVRRQLTLPERKLDLMEMQCEMGLRWLREGRIEGMIFLASCICDLDLDSVEWTRSWVAEIGDEKVFPGAQTQK